MPEMEVGIHIAPPYFNLLFIQFHTCKCKSKIENAVSSFIYANLKQQWKPILLVTPSGQTSSSCFNKASVNGCLALPDIMLHCTPGIQVTNKLLFAPFIFHGKTGCFQQFEGERYRSVTFFDMASFLIPVGPVTSW